MFIWTEWICNYLGDSSGSTCMSPAGSVSIVAICDRAPALYRYLSAHCMVWRRSQEGGLHGAHYGLHD